jgi:two-component system, NarL family, invasion response regulator UvrY
MIRLLIADDHQILREGLKHVVAQSRDIQVLGEAEDGPSLVDLCSKVDADVLLLDVSMPGPGVLEIIKTLKQLRPKLGILVLSVHPERHYARRVLIAGADGYLTKSESSEALAPAIRNVYAGRKFLTPSLAQELATDLTRKRSGQLHEALSNREYQVFVQLGAGKGIEEIATQLKLSPKTVRTYRSRILEKTNLKSTAEIIFYAINQGLVTNLGDGSMASLSGRSQGDQS